MHIGYLGIVILMVVSPFPPEVFMPLAGFMVAQGELNFLLVVLAGVVGFLLSVLPWYLTSRYLGKDGLNQLLKKHRKWLFSPKKLEKANRWFRHYGNRAVFFSLLIPGIRTFIAIPAGISGMPLTSFVLYSTLSATFWLAVLTGAGYVLGNNYYLVNKYIGPAYRVVIAVFVIAIAVSIVGHFIRRRRSSPDT